MSDSNGEFHIIAKVDDLLVFYSDKFEYFRKLIDEEDIKSDILVITMIPKATELKEVVINNYPEINAIALGISPKGIKHYTPAERKLKTAGDFKPVDLLGLLVGSLQIDPIINAISGRTALLKKELAVEKKETLLKQLNQNYEDDYYIKHFKIPSSHVNGFKYFIIEDIEFTNQFHSKNKAMTKFVMEKLALKYNQIILKKKRAIN